MRVVLIVSALALVFFSGVTSAADVVAPPVVQKAQTAIAKLFIKPVVFRGTLGDVDVQMRLSVKEDFAEGLEGEYFRFGRSQKILLAGEMETDGFFIEESENGTDVSGQWEGKLDGDSIRGSWMSADGEMTKPFVLNVVRIKSAAAVPKRTAVKSIRPATSQRSAASGSDAAK